MNDYRPPGSRLMPEVIKNLLIINVIMYLITIFLEQQGVSLIDILGLHYFASEKFRIYQFITYMFMHDIGNIWHIAMNMFILYMFGISVENTWGGKKFLTYYILTGLGAAVAHYAIVYFQLKPGIEIFDDYINAADVSKMYALVNSESYGAYFGSDFRDLLRVNPARALDVSMDIVTQIKNDMLNAPVVIGASGAIYGVLLAYGMLFPNSVLLMFFVVPMKAKYAVFVFGFLELYFGISGGDNVAHFAHLGGLVTGLIIMLYWRNKNRNRRNDYFEY